MSVTSLISKESFFKLYYYICLTWKLSNVMRGASQRQINEAAKVGICFFKFPLFVQYVFDVFLTSLYILYIGRFFYD